MVAWGIVSIIFGMVIYCCGNAINNDIDAQMESLFNNGVVNPGSNYVTVGAVLIAVGVVLLVVGAFKKYNLKEARRQVDIVSKPFATERIVWADSQRAKCVCELCQTADSYARCCALKSACGTRYLFLCDECIASYDVDTDE